VRASRDRGAVDAALAHLKRACRSDENIMYPLIDACRALATEGEIVAAMVEVFGRYVERASF
jgi:methylmalonyl-CoA mutase N-terminal domain/subunit